MTQPLVKILQIDSDELSLTIRTEIQTNVILEDISDVITGSPVTFGFIIEFGGSPTRWRAVKNAGSLGDTNVSGASIGDFLYFAGSPGGWTNTSTIQLLTDRIVVAGVSGENFGSPRLGGSPQVVIAGSPANRTSLEVRSAVPGLMLYDTDAGADEKAWRFIVDDGDLLGELRSDSGKTANRWLELTRSGTSVSDLYLYAGQQEKAIHAIAGAAVEFYHNNINVAETTTAVGGGLRINNLATGAGFERALTTSDLGTILTVNAGDGIDFFGSPVTVRVDATVVRFSGSPIVVGSPTAGEIIYDDGSGRFVRLPRGTTGQTLSMGSPLLPSWKPGVFAIPLSTSSNFKVPFLNTAASLAGFFAVLHETTGTFTYNPSTNTLAAANFSGNATTASQWLTTRTIQLSGEVTSDAVNIDGSGNITITNTAVTGSPLLLTNIVGGDGINVTSGSPNHTIAVDSTVIRTTGNQSIAGNLTLTGSPASQFQITDGTQELTLDVGTIVANHHGIWLHQTAEAATNYALLGDTSNNTLLNAAGSLFFRINNSNVMSHSSTLTTSLLRHTFTQTGTTGDDGGSISLNSSNPSFNVAESDAPLNEQNWLYFWTGGEYQIRMYNDVWSGSPALTIPFSITRSGVIPGQVIIGDGATLRIRDSGDSDFADFSHDGTDFNTTLVNTTDWNITGLTTAFKIFDGANASFNFDITNSRLELRDGYALRIQNSGDTDYAEFSHDGTDFNTNFANTTDWNISNARDIQFGSPVHTVLTTGPWSGQADHAIRAQGNTLLDNVEFALAVKDGTNNRRARMFLSDEQGTWGLQASASSGVPTFQLFYANTLVLDSDGTSTNFKGYAGGIRIYDSGNTDFITLRDTDAVSFIESIVNPIQINPGGAYVGVIGGNQFRVFDGSNLDYAQFVHDGTDFNMTLVNTTDWNVTFGSPEGNMIVNATLVTGDGTSTSGQTIIEGHYAGANRLNIFGGEFSSGATVLGFAARPNIGGAGFDSSAGNSSFGRAIMTMDSSGFDFLTTTTATVAIGDPVTLTSRMTIANAGAVDVVGALTAASYDGVVLTTGGVATNYLDETGAYSVPASSGDPDQNLFLNVLSDAGTAVADNTTDTLSILGGTGISTAVSADAVTITNDDPNVDQNLWLNMDADSGGPVAANITTDTFTITGGASITTAISGDVVTITNDAPNVDQNLFLNVLSDAGTAVADNTTDTLSILGGTGISTAVSADAVTITNDAPNVTQNLWLNMDADSGGPVAANIATDTFTITGGTGIVSAISGDGVGITLALSELGVTVPVAGDWLAFDDAGTSSKALFSAVPLSIFSNDLTTITIADEAADATCFVGFYTAATGALQPKTNAGLTFDSVAQDLTVGGAITGTTKSFLIDHPSKPDMKLRHGSLEGPEHAVYVRGHLSGSRLIELPDYWTNLINPDSITATLTPASKYQELYVQKIENNIVYVGGNNSQEVDCFYTVYAERIDIDKLVVEE